MLTLGLTLLLIATTCFLILWRCRAQNLMDENVELAMKLGVAYKHEHELYKKITELAQESTEAGAELNQQITDNRKLRDLITETRKENEQLQSQITVKLKAAETDAQFWQNAHKELQDQLLDIVYPNRKDNT
jgi:ribosomal protein L18E